MEQLFTALMLTTRSSTGPHWVPEPVTLSWVEFWHLRLAEMEFHNCCLLSNFLDIVSQRLHSMCWFSHRRSPSPPGGHTMVSSVAAGSVTAHTLLCISHGDDSAVFRFFLSLVTLTFDLWPWHSNSGENCLQCTWPPSFIVLRLIVRKALCAQTHWQTDRRRWKHPPSFTMLRRWVIRETG